MVVQVAGKGVVIIGDHLQVNCYEEVAATEVRTHGVCVEGTLVACARIRTTTCGGDI